MTIMRSDPLIQRSSFSTPAQPETSWKSTGFKLSHCLTQSNSMQMGQTHISLYITDKVYDTRLWAVKLFQHSSSYWEPS